MILMARDQFRGGCMQHNRAGPLMIFALLTLILLTITTPIAAWLPLMAAAVLGIGLFAWATMGLARDANDKKTTYYLVKYTLIGLATILAAGALVLGTAPMQAIAVSSLLILTAILVINPLVRARAATFVQLPFQMGFSKMFGNLRTSAANLTASTRRSVTGFQRSILRPAIQL